MAEDKKEDSKKEEGDEAAAKKGGSKKTLLIAGGAVFLVLAIGVPVGIFALKGGSKSKVEALPGDAAEIPSGLKAEGSTDEDELQENEEAMGAFFPLDTFVVNLNGGKFLRAQVQLEFQGRDIPKRFYPRLIPARDSIITLLASRSADDISSTQGREALKRDVRDLLNELLKKEEVKHVYFTQFVVQ
ncbi:MAG: hypothetical protein DCC75_11770 [Proteobacteria bacterium]|nr:MAG: hypothetical protein DCC75_11770 [Pseudomonadota bacterium]